MGGDGGASGVFKSEVVRLLEAVLYIFFVTVIIHDFSFLLLLHGSFVLPAFI